MESKPNKEMINRINELAELAKQRPLTDEERAEQDKLRKDYITWFRAALRGNA